jgi:hypothetical protein
MKLSWNPPKVTPQRAIYRWSASHSAIVHEGAVLPSGTVLPARRFTDYAVANTPVAQMVADAVRSGQSIDVAFRLAAHGLNAAFTDAIVSPIWDWPRLTVRSDGSIASSPRDAVDEAELRDSQSMIFEVSYG